MSQTGEQSDGGGRKGAANTAFLHNFLRNVESNNKREIIKNAARAAHQSLGAAGAAALRPQLHRAAAKGLPSVTRVSLKAAEDQKLVLCTSLLREVAQVFGYRLRVTAGGMPVEPMQGCQEQQQHCDEVGGDHEQRQQQQTDSIPLKPLTAALYDPDADDYYEEDEQDEDDGAVLRTNVRGRALAGRTGSMALHRVASGRVTRRTGVVSARPGLLLGALLGAGLTSKRAPPTAAAAVQHARLRRLLSGGSEGPGSPRVAAKKLAATAQAAARPHAEQQNGDVDADGGEAGDEHTEVAGGDEQQQGKETDQEQPKQRPRSAAPEKAPGTSAARPGSAPAAGGKRQQAQAADGAGAAAAAASGGLTSKRPRIVFSLGQADAECQGLGRSVEEGAAADGVAAVGGPARQTRQQQPLEDKGDADAEEQEDGSEVPHQQEGQPDTRGHFLQPAAAASTAAAGIPQRRSVLERLGDGVAPAAGAAVPPVARRPVAPSPRMVAEGRGQRGAGRRGSQRHESDEEDSWAGAGLTSEEDEDGEEEEQQPRQQQEHDPQLKDQQQHGEEEDKRKRQEQRQEKEKEKDKEKEKRQEELEVQKQQQHEKVAEKEKRQQEREVRKQQQREKEKPKQKHDEKEKEKQQRQQEKLQHQRPKSQVTASTPVASSREAPISGSVRRVSAGGSQAAGGQGRTPAEVDDGGPAAVRVEQHEDKLRQQQQQDKQRVSVHSRLGTTRSAGAAAGRSAAQDGLRDKDGDRASAKDKKRGSGSIFGSAVASLRS